MGAPPRLIGMPWVTAGLVAAVLLAQWLPGTVELFAYDRAAVAQGEFWRLVTGSFVHYSPTHLGNSLLALLPAAWLIETRRRADVLPISISAALAIGVVLLVGEPGIVEYRGASGIGLALLAYAGLSGLHGERRWRTVCQVLLLVLGAKLIAETAGWQLRNWQTDDAGFVPVLSSHLTGVAIGAAAYLRRRSHRGPPFVTKATIG